MMRCNGFARCSLGIVALVGCWPASSAEAQERVPTASSSAFECVAGEVSATKTADAQTAVGIVCRELARASGRVGRYRVSLRPLGYSMILEAERLDIPSSRTVTLAGVEEIPTAAPRIAQALLHKEPLTKSQRVDTLLMNETRETPLKGGKVSVGIGVLGLAAPGQTGRTGGGFTLALAYDTPDFSVPVQFRVAGVGGDDRSGASLVGLDVGMRWMLSRKNATPFVGGGLGWLGWHVDDDSAEWGESRASYTGAAPYLEAGCEMLRLHRARVTASIRVDLPLQGLDRPETYRWEYVGKTERRVTVPGSSFYAVPVTVGVSVAF